MDLSRSPIFKPARKTSAASSDSSLPYAAMISNPSKEHLLPLAKASPTQSPESLIRKRLRTPARTVALAAFSISLLCLLLLGLSALLVYFYLNDLREGSAAQKHEEVCMPCDQVRPNPLSSDHSPLLDLLEVRASRQDDGRDTDVCCAHTAAQYAALFKLILLRQEEVKRLADVLGPAGKIISANNDLQNDPETLMAGMSRAVSAHLVHKPSSSGSDESGIQRWKSGAESPMSHVRAGLAFHNSSKITVITPGLYFIYCQVLYNKADRPPSSTLASSYVMRNSLSYPASSGILLKSRHTRYDDDTDRHSSYVGGLFFLHKGDQLYVRVSVPEAVSHDDRASFFGLFKVGN